MELRPVGYDSADALLLTAEVQAEYAHRYRSEGDEAPIDAAEFVPPEGLFVIAYDAEVAVGMGGWRRLGERAEIKRMYVREFARGRGVARHVLAYIERTVTSAGIQRLVLETGPVLPGAIDLYVSAGYTDVPPFGYYAESASSRWLGKTLPGANGAPTEERS